RLLFTFPDHLEVDARVDAESPQTIEGREERDDRSLVVAGRTAEESPLGIEWGLRTFPVHLVLARAKGAASHHRNEWIRLPLRRGHRLAVVVRIEDDGVPRSRAAEGAHHQRRCSFRAELQRLEAPLPQEDLESIGSSSEP